MFGIDIDKFFTKKTKNFEEFIKILKEKKCKCVKAKTVIIDGSDVKSGIGEFEYYLELKSVTSGNKKITYIEECEKRIGSNSPANAKERGKAVMRLLLTAETRIEMVKKRIPDIEIMAPLSDKESGELHKKAEDLNIKPFDLPEA